MMAAETEDTGVEGAAGGAPGAGAGHPGDHEPPQPILQSEEPGRAAGQSQGAPGRRNPGLDQDHRQTSNKVNT